jgi:hypothetical protein
LHKLTTGCFHNATCAPVDARAGLDVFGRWVDKVGSRGAARAFSVVLLLVVGVVILGFAGAARAQTPSPEDTLTAFSAVQRAVRAWTPLKETETLPRAAGACVTLKLHGEVIARGEAWAPVLAPGSANSEVVREALASALKQGEPKLGVPNDAMRDAAVLEVAKEIVISVELAGPLGVIEPATWEEAETSLRPGLDGVAVRSANEMVAIFPSQMMLTNTLPHRALGSAAAQIIGKGGAAAALDEPKKIREKNAIRMYNFRVGHAAQGTAEGSAVALFRGGRLMAPGAMMTVAQVRQMGADAAQFLIRNGGSNAANAECPNGTLSELLALYALGRWMQVQQVDGFTWETGLARCAEKLAWEKPEPGSQAMHVLAKFRNDPPWPPKPVSRELFLTRMRVESRLLFAPQALQPAQQNPGEVKELDPNAVRLELRPLSVLAALDLEASTNERLPAVFEGTGKLLQSIHSEVGENRLISMMPWLGWADMEQELTIRAAGGPAKDIQFAVAYRRMREQCWKHQLTASTATEDTLDMIGGIVFTSGIGEGSGNPYPTWQCVRPLAFIATMLGDSRLTEPKERDAEIVRMMQAMRFLRQLQVDDASAWMYPNPELAKGGIRAAAWDNSEPIDATSLTLLCVTEFLKSLDKLSAPAAPPAVAPAPAVK